MQTEDAAGGEDNWLGAESGAAGQIMGGETLRIPHVLLQAKERHRGWCSPRRFHHIRTHRKCQRFVSDTASLARVIDPLEIAATASRATIIALMASISTAPTVSTSVQVFRPDGRAADALRPVRITPGFVAMAEGSVLIEAGNTRLL